MSKICIKCNKEIIPNDIVYYTLDSQLLSKPCCSLKCAESFKSDTILNLEKIITIVKEEKIAKR